MKKQSIESQVKELERRTRNQLGVQKFMLQVQIDTLKKAEAIRTAALAVVRSRRSPLPGERYSIVNGKRFEELRRIVVATKPFNPLTKRLEAKARAFIREAN